MSEPRTEPHVYRPSSPAGVNMFITHCSHGLDLRLNPRCYLCRPEAAAPDLDALRTAVEGLRDVSKPREFDLTNGTRDRRLGWNLALDRVLALLTLDKAKAEAKTQPERIEFCGDCDGVGWVEGGKALQTTCGRCQGSGLEPKRPIYGDKRDDLPF